MDGMYLSTKDTKDQGVSIVRFDFQLRATTRVAPTEMEAGLVCECRSMLIIERHWIDLEQGRAEYCCTYSSTRT